MTFSGPGMPQRNQVMLTGWVVKPPQFHHQLNGTPVLQFWLKVDDPEGRSRELSFKDPSVRPSRQAASSWGSIQIVAFGPLAHARSLLQRGQRLFVKGRLMERRWRLADGRYRSRMEVIASELLPEEEFEIPSKEPK